MQTKRYFLRALTEQEALRMVNLTHEVASPQCNVGAAWPRAGEFILVIIVAFVLAGSRIRGYFCNQVLLCCSTEFRDCRVRVRSGGGCHCDNRLGLRPVLRPVIGHGQRSAPSCHGVARVGCHLHWHYH